MKFPHRFSQRFSAKAVTQVISTLIFLWANSSIAQLSTYYWKDNNNNGQWDWSNNQWWHSENNGLSGSVNNNGGARVYFENTGQQATTINNAGAFSGGWFKLNSIFAAANSRGLIRNSD